MHIFFDAVEGSYHNLPEPTMVSIELVEMVAAIMVATEKLLRKRIHREFLEQGTQRRRLTLLEGMGRQILLHASAPLLCLLGVWWPLVLSF